MTDIDHHEAKLTAQRVQQLSDEYWHTLDGSCNAMDDDAWVGPVGRRFREELEQQRATLHRLLEKAVHSAETKAHSMRGKP
ncbi:hypothetical protein ACH4LN_08195 [Streptomyces albus]|uniref:hypothetical protein n=1 Tax=Streptomyces TaxID=1883 RepID=UPI00034E453D|nr:MULTISPECIES: hypothetical protein [Streptomyces]EPD97301.1 hypothetical protein HMPREF1486_00087 [Streptomyces sp. HPH0547]KPC96093.1 hypothetical protein ADL27_05595 [Streptomyces sp. NRRL F-6602]QID34636.1 hypothetical protein G3260_000457 [Streptomyces albus]